MVWSCLPFIRSSQNILQGTVKGGRRQGRQRKRWEDNLREWTGLEFGKSQRAVENREKWRKLVAKSSVVPQRHIAVKGLMMMMTQTATVTRTRPDLTSGSPADDLEQAGAAVL